MKLFKITKTLIKASLPNFKRIYANEKNKQAKNYKQKDILVSPYFFVENTLLSPHVRLFGSGKIANSKVGEYTYIHSDSTIAYAEIGKFCSIAQNTIIAQGEHPVNFISTHPFFYSKNAPWENKFSKNDVIKEHAKVIIENDVWIGAGCYIKDGVNIGNGCIIASGSVVIKDVPDYAIVGGVPAKIIKFRFSDKIVKQLVELKWWNFDVDILKTCKNNFKVNLTEEKIKLFIDCLNENR